MKKILFYINAIHHGGAERVMVNLASSLSNYGYECILVTSIIEPWEYNYDENIKRISLYNTHMPKSFIKRNVFTTLKLRKVIMKEKPNIVISFMAEPNFRAIIASMMTHTKCLISVRNDPEKEYPNYIFKFIAKILYSFADGVVFQTEDAKKWFSKKIQKKSRIIFNQVDEIFFNTPLKSEREGIVTTGRLVEQKNHELLIRAYERIADKISDDLYIYGEGELENKLRKLIIELKMEDRIHLPGATKDVANVLSRSKVFILSSDYEGMPNSLLEAMAMGLPCISTDCPCGGPRTVLKNLSDEVLVPVSNIVAMAEALENLFIKSSDDMDKISFKLKIEAEKFRPSVVIDYWKSYIEDIV